MEEGIIKGHGLTFSLDTNKGNTGQGGDTGGSGDGAGNGNDSETGSGNEETTDDD